MDPIASLSMGLGLGSAFVAVPVLAFLLYLAWSAVSIIPPDQGRALPPRGPSRPPWMDDETKETSE